MLYTEYRPKKFNQIIGQPTAVALKNAVKKDHVLRAQLYSGERGTGKTTCARVYAHAINCRKLVDGEPCGKCPACKSEPYHEFDVANMSGGLENVLQILSSKPKYNFQVVILDEIHSLSSKQQETLGSFIARLPDKSVILMATTDPQKLSAKITQQVTWWPLKRVSPDEISAHLKMICKAEKIRYQSAAIDIISDKAEGSVRDALSILDAVTTGVRQVSTERIKSILSVASLGSLVDAMISGDYAVVLQEAKELYSTYAVKTMLYQLASEFVWKAKELVQDNQDDLAISKYLAVSSFLREVPRDLQNEFAFFEIQILKCTASLKTLVKQREEAESKLFIDFVLSFDVSVEAGLYSRDALQDLNCLTGVVVNGSVVTYQHMKNQDVLDELVLAFNDYTEQSYEWRRKEYVEKKSTSKRRRPRKRKPTAAKGRRRKKRPRRSRKVATRNKPKVTYDLGN